MIPILAEGSIILVKTATHDEVIQKVRTEAKTSRAKVPPDMRAEPYGDEYSKTSKPETGFSSTFKTAGQSAPEDKSAKMSSAFNGASKANQPDDEPEPPKPKPL